MTKWGDGKGVWGWPWKEFFAVQFDMVLFNICEVVQNLPVSFKGPT